MTLSSGSRQHRKSMLPIPRPSSRIGSRRITSGDTSRISRRIQSPMLAAPASLISGPSTHPRVPHPAASRILPPPEFSTRRACLPSRIPSPSIQTSCPTSEQSETSSTASIPRTEGGSVEGPHPTPPASVETSINDQEGCAKVESFAQHQNADAWGSPAPHARYPSRRRESTALTTNSFSRAENSTLGDATSHPVANEKPAMTSNVSGKENCRPPARVRVIVPAPLTVVVPSRPTRRSAVPLVPSSQMSPRPLLIEKKSLMASPGQVLQAKSAAESSFVQAGIKALIGELDHFAKEWTGMFDELHAGAGCHGGEVADASTHIQPIVESETPGTLQVDDLRGQTNNSENGRTAGGIILSSDCREQAGEMTAQLTPSASLVSSIGSIQASSTDGECDHFDVSAASLVRWQHRDNTMLKDAPTVAADLVPELSAIISALQSDSATDTTTHRHSSKEVEVVRNAPQPVTPRAPRFMLPLPEINQSPIISGPHLIDLTSAVLSNRKDGITKFLEPPPTPTRGTTETTRRDANSRPCPLSMAPVAHLSSSPAPITMSLVSVSIPHTSSPLAHQRLRGSPPQRSAHTVSDAEPTRSTSLRGLRAIFKRTSAGLTSSQRERAESLKDLISEPRVLSLGSVSITNLRDVGIPGGGAVPAAGQKDDAENSGELARKTTVNW